MDAPWLYSPSRRLEEALRWGGLYGCGSEREAVVQLLEKTAARVRHQEHYGLLHGRAVLDWPPFARVNRLMDPPARTLGGLFHALTRNDPRLPPALDDVVRFLASLGRQDLDSELSYLFTVPAPLERDTRRAVLRAFGAEAPPAEPLAPSREKAPAPSTAPTSQNPCPVSGPPPCSRAIALLRRSGWSPPTGVWRAAASPAPTKPRAAPWPCCGRYSTPERARPRRPEGAPVREADKCRVAPPSRPRRLALTSQTHLLLASSEQSATRSCVRFHLLTTVRDGAGWTLAATRSWPLRTGGSNVRHTESG